MPIADVAYFEFPNFGTPMKKNSIFKNKQKQRLALIVCIVFVLGNRVYTEYTC